jgi:hypothetical protein
MKDAIAPLGKHYHLLPRLLQELAAPALPAHRLSAHGVALTLQPIRRRQGKHQQGEQHMMLESQQGMITYYIT